MPLAHAFVTAPSSTPTRWMLFLHGILGSGANWRTYAKAIVAARPDWGAVLVDLRLHGESQEGFSPPHTLEAAAQDLEALIASLEPEKPVRGVLAHSFGGKVALVLAERHRAIEHLFVIDSTPSARPDARGSESTRHIVELLRNLPDEFANRNDFTAWIESRGVSRPVAMWLAMNVRPIPNTTRFVFRVDVAGIRQMLDDYFARDLWGVLERPHPSLRAHLIVGGRSGVVDEADRARARACASAAGGAGTTLDVIERADHWVHVDAPDELQALVLGHLAGV